MPKIEIASTYFIHLTTADVLEMLKLKDPDKYKNATIDIAAVLHPDEIEMHPDDPTGLFFFSEGTPFSVRVTEIHK